MARTLRPVDAVASAVGKTKVVRVWGLLVLRVRGAVFLSTAAVHPAHHEAHHHAAGQEQEIEWWHSGPARECRSGPCRQFAPVFERASPDHPDVVFGAVDIEALQPIAALEQVFTAVRDLNIQQVRNDTKQQRSA